jgi:quercetin dioxygenase-like cupin family protein
MVHVFDRAVAGSVRVGTVDVSRWEQYALGELMPFQAMWYSVPPGSKSPQDRHPEVELSVVLTGSATVEAGGAVVEVPAGSSFLLPADEAHVVHNRSATESLVVFSAYWLPGGAS